MLGAEIDFLSKELTINPAPLLPAGKTPCLRNARSSTCQMQMATPESVKDVLCRQESLLSAKSSLRLRSLVMEYSIPARDLSYDWMGDATESYHVGDQILVRITSVSLSSVTDISVKAEC